MIRLEMAWATCPSPQVQRTQWLYRMINSKRPLEEKLSLFWHGVICTGQAKVDHNRQMAATVQMFRRHGMGSFRDLLIMVSQDPGMIYFLDNCMSHNGAINENWGRELLELFSMGVGNYTEDDVKEASRAFTGWTNAATFPPYPYGRADVWDFQYDLTDHDHDLKAFLGQSGKLNGEDIVDIVCRQPATARFIARHMYAYFVADDVPVPQWGITPPRDQAAIDALVRAYFDSHYEIRSMLRVLFNSPFFKDARFQKVKSPTEVVVSTVRLAKDLTFPEPRLFDVLCQCVYMGQELYNPPSVEGWHTGQEWIDSGTLVERVNFLSEELGDETKQGVREIAERLKARGKSLTTEALVDGCLEQLGDVKVPPDTRKTLVDFASNGGPIETNNEGFTRRTAALLSVIVATKEYQFN